MLNRMWSEEIAEIEVRREENPPEPLGSSNWDPAYLDLLRRTR